MDLQSFVDSCCASLQREREENCQLNLKGLIEELEKLPEEVKNNKAMLDLDGIEDILIFVTGIGSYRGYYSDLAIRYSLDFEEAISTNQLIQKLKEAIGKTFIGYKGGEFVMHEGTVVWLGNCGKTTDRQITGIIHDYHNCYIKSTRIED